MHCWGPVRIMHSWILAGRMVFVTGVWIACVYAHCDIQIIIWRFVPKGGGAEIVLLPFLTLSFHCNSLRKNRHIGSIALTMTAQHFWYRCSSQGRKDKRVHTGVGLKFKTCASQPAAEIYLSGLMWSMENGGDYGKYSLRVTFNLTPEPQHLILHLPLWFLLFLIYKSWSD